ncbi:MAG: sensor histidine kinase [Pseudomonadota bacterium]
MSSIRLRLLLWLIGPILLVNLAGGALSYMMAWVPARIAFDQSLGDAARALSVRVRAGRDTPEIDLPPQAEEVLRADEVDSLYFCVRAPNGQLLAGDGDFPALPAGPRSGAGAAFDGQMRGEPVRVVTRSVLAGGQQVRIGVAKTLRKRAQTRSAIVRALFLIESLMTFALAAVIWYSVTNGLRPLNRMRAELNARDGADLSPIGDDGVPFELAPAVRAFNDLLAKLQAAAKSQHDFLANVAHQLRTPLAGLRTQLELVEKRHAGEPETAHAIGLMLSSTERMIRQTNQLLALARAEPSYFEATRLEPVALQDLVAESIQHFVEQAAIKGIDLGYDLQATMVRGDRFLLRDLIDNLIDNAIRYTPSQGTVTVRCRERDGGQLVVEDSGPGIEPARRAQVFNRFVRFDDKTSGSGLGLAIVRDIALAHGAAIDLGAQPGGGAVFTITFPHLH